jgi:hypothetical protein
MRQGPQYCIEHRIEALSQVLGKEPQHEVTVCLQKNVFAPIATVGNYLSVLFSGGEQALRLTVAAGHVVPALGIAQREDPKVGNIVGRPAFARP